jgi:dihydroxyacid dehydratase/phosphogluconate dehydratase
MHTPKTSCGRTCAGKTLGENLESVPDLKKGQEVIMPLEKPIKSSGHLQVNHAPDQAPDVESRH